jgi:hypothetical protein
MNNSFFESPLNEYTDIPTDLPPVIPDTTGKIEIQYTKGKTITIDEVPKYDKPDITKLDYVNPEYTNPCEMYMNWHKKHPQGQWGPMKSENKMLSYERKNIINGNI